MIPPISAKGCCSFTVLLVTLLLLLFARRSAGMPASKVPAISLVLPLLRGPSRDCRRSVLTVRHCSHGKYLSVVVGVVVPLFVVVPVSCSGGCGAPVCGCCGASVVVVVLSRGAPVRGGCGAPVCGGCGAPVVVVVVGFKGDLPISHNVGLRPWPVFVSPRSFLRTNCESHARGPQAARVR